MVMAFALLLPLSPLSFRPFLSVSPSPLLLSSRIKSLDASSPPRRSLLSPLRSLPKLETSVSSLPELEASVSSLLASPATWQTALSSNLVIFLVGSPVLRTGLSSSGFAAAFLLGTLTWRAFGPQGFLLVALYFVLGTGVTKLKMAQKEQMGIAERGNGRRGPGSVIGSGAAGSVCAFASILGFGGPALLPLWKLGFVASFCTKLSDTAASEIGKAYGKTAYLVTNLKVVPRGTEGAVSLEGTIAGFFASLFLASFAYFLHEVDLPQVLICVIASQIANFGESLIGAALQDREGFQWLNNDVVNVINISTGSILAILMQQILLHS